MFLKRCTDSKSRAPILKRLPEHPKTENFPIPIFLMVTMPKKEAIFDGLSTKEAIVDYIPIDHEDNFEGEVR